VDASDEHFVGFPSQRAPTELQDAVVDTAHAASKRSLKRAPEALSRNGGSNSVREE
jgi:hypothetical protein